MTVNKNELFEYYEVSYGIYTREEMEKAKEYLEKIQEKKLENISVCEFLEIVNDMLGYVYAEEETEEKTEDETENEAENETENEEEIEEVRRLIYDFFFKW